MPRSSEESTGAGGRIREIRNRRGLTLERLADRARISKSFLWEVEQDRSDISGMKLLRVANVLGASIDYLLKGTPVPQVEKPSSVQIPAEVDELAKEEGLSYRQTVALLGVDHSVMAHRRDIREERTKEYWRRLYEQIRPFLEEQP